MNPPVFRDGDVVRRVHSYWLVCGALAMMELGLRWLHDRGRITWTFSSDLAYTSPGFFPPTENP